MGQHVVVVSTGQNVANLGPLRYCQDLRDDLTVWVAHAGRVSRESTNRLRDTLQSRYHMNVEEFSGPVPEDLGEIADWVTGAIGEIEGCDSDASITLIGNGGTKPMFAALLDHFGSRLEEVVYGEGEPVRLQVNLRGPGNFETAEFEFAPFVQLDDVLLCNGLTRRDGCLLWSAERSERFDDPGIGDLFRNPGTFESTFSADANRFAARRDRLLKGDPSALDYDDCKTVVEKQFSAFRLALAGLLRAQVPAGRVLASADVQGDLDKIDRDLDCVREKLARSRADWERNGRPALMEPDRKAGVEYILAPLLPDVDAVAGSLSQGPLKAFFDAVVTLRTAAFERLERIPPATLNAGNLFESAVASRVLSFLRADVSRLAIVSELWLRPKVERAGGTWAEWDTLIVLRNGVLINIECKSWAGDKKDLDARVTTMHQGASSLAVMWLCSPLPTGLADRPWFRELHNFRLASERLGRPHLYFSLPDQPDSYTLDGVTFSCPSFEDQFSALFERYQP